MALLISCDTPHATLLLAVVCEDGLLRFPNDASFWPGIGFKVDQMLPINGQLQTVSKKYIQDQWSNVSIWQEYSALLQHDGVIDSTLYVAKIDPDYTLLPSGWASWQTLPALIRTLPKDRNRLAFLKAWQILSGGLEESTKALDVAEVAKHLKSLEKDTQKS
jgi:hypothetical protein